MRRFGFMVLIYLFAFIHTTSAQTTVYGTTIGSVPASATLQSSAVANGNGTPFNFTTKNVFGAVNFVVVCVSCSGGTTVAFQGSPDGTNWVNIDAVLQPGNSGSTIVSSTVPSGSVTQVFLASIMGMQEVRAPISSYSAGTVTVTVYAEPGSGWATVTKLDNSNLGFGTAGTPSSQVQTIQGVTSMTPVAVSPTTAANAVGNPFYFNPGTGANIAQETGGNLATLAGGLTSSVYQENLKQVNGATTLAGTGAVGTGAQRVAIGTDTATIAGSAPGTAGTASANVVTVQGVAAMTPILDTPQATENHIGEVGGNSIVVTNAMTTTNATTTTGQSIGGLQTLTNMARVSGALGASGTSGLIQNLTVTFKDAVGAGPLDVYFFNANPSGSTCTNDSALVLADADRTKMIGIAHVTDFTASNTAAVGQALNLAMSYDLSSATSVFACVVARASFAITGTANAALIVAALRN